MPPRPRLRSSASSALVMCFCVIVLLVASDTCLARSTTVSTARARVLHRRQQDPTGQHDLGSGRVTATIRVPSSPSTSSRRTTTRTTSSRSSSTRTTLVQPTTRTTTTTSPTTQDTTTTSTFPQVPILPTDASPSDQGKIDESSSPPAWSDRIEIVPAGPDAAGRPITINAALAGPGRQTARASFLLAAGCFAASFVVVAAV